MTYANTTAYCSAVQLTTHQVIAKKSEKSCYLSFLFLPLFLLRVFLLVLLRGFFPLTFAFGNIAHVARLRCFFRLRLRRTFRGGGFLAGTFTFALGTAASSLGLGFCGRFLLCGLRIAVVSAQPQTAISTSAEVAQDMPKVIRQEAESSTKQLLVSILFFI